MILYVYYNIKVFIFMYYFILYNISGQCTSARIMKIIFCDLIEIEKNMYRECSFLARLQ